MDYSNNNIYNFYVLFKNKMKLYCRQLKARYLMDRLNYLHNLIENERECLYLPLSWDHTWLYNEMIKDKGAYNELMTKADRIAYKINKLLN